MNLKTAVEPRIDTDGHRYQELDNIDRFTRKVTSVDSHLSVLIRVYPWLTCLGFSATAEFRFIRKDRSVSLVAAPVPWWEKWA